jgi:hypothetical protein
LWNATGNWSPAVKLAIYFNSLLSVWHTGLDPKQHEWISGTTGCQYTPWPGGG